MMTSKARGVRPPDPVDRLVAEGVRVANAHDVHALARVVVELRQHFLATDGTVDWAGRTKPYRDAVGRIFSESSLDPETLTRLKSTLRYHVGNLVREVAPADELEDLGLQQRRPVDRVRDQRDRQAARARIGALAEKKGLRRANVVRLVVSAEETLAQVDEGRLDEVDPELVEDTVASLEAISARSTSLLSALEPRRVRRRGGIRRKPPAT